MNDSYEKDFIDVAGLNLIAEVSSGNYNKFKCFYPIAKSKDLDSVKPNISKTIIPFISLKNLAAVVLHDS